MSGNKIKVVKKKGLANIVISSVKGQQVSEHEVYSINCNEIPGLLHTDVFVSGASFKLVYNVNGFTSLKDYLMNPLTKESFTTLLESILETLNSMKRQFFHQEGLIMDYTKVFVNPLTQKIHFIYVPIQGYNGGYDLREFLLNIIQYGSFAQWEDSSYVRDYITILNSGINFSEFELEEYIKKLSGKETKEDLVECRFCHAMVVKSCNFCTQCGSKMDATRSGLTGNCATGNVTYDPTAGYSEGTTVLGAGSFDFDEEEGTTVLSPQELYPSRLQAYLIRIKTDEKIDITKDTFTVGKGKNDTDYMVTDNSAVSRHHIRIERRDDEFFVIDLNSTNKTFVNDIVINPETEVQLFSETKLRLGNEEFIFYIDED